MTKRVSPLRATKFYCASCERCCRCWREERAGRPRARRPSVRTGSASAAASVGGTSTITFCNGTCCARRHQFAPPWPAPGWAVGDLMKKSVTILLPFAWNHATLHVAAAAVAVVSAQDAGSGETTTTINATCTPITPFTCPSGSWMPRPSLQNCGCILRHVRPAALFAVFSLPPMFLVVFVITVVSLGTLFVKNCVLAEEGEARRGHTSMVADQAGKRCGIAGRVYSCLHSIIKYYTTHLKCVHLRHASPSVSSRGVKARLHACAGADDDLRKGITRAVVLPCPLAGCWSRRPPPSPPHSPLHARARRAAPAMDASHAIRRSHRSASSHSTLAREAGRGVCPYWAHRPFNTRTLSW